MTRLILPFFTVCLLTILNTDSAGQENPMQVLHSYLGKWETTVDSRPNLSDKKGFSGSGKLTGKKILGGKYIQVSGFGTSPKSGRQDFQFTMTYDQRLQSYRRWIFNSEGISSESRGEWNVEKNIMTWTTIGLPQNIAFTVTTRITKEGFEETILGKRSDGTVLKDITVKAKKKAP